MENIINEYNKGKSILFHCLAGNQRSAGFLCAFLMKYKKPVIITLSVIMLQLIFGFDSKFCIMNIIWLLV